MMIGGSRGIQWGHWLTMAVVAFGCFAAFAQEAADKRGDAAESPVAKVKDAAPAPKAEADPYERHWYFATGASNYHPRLNESEAKIDRQLNDVLGWLPFWKAPTTFRDWEQDFLLWDMTVGLGSDITPKTSWMCWTGGAIGEIKNNEHYGPLETDITFTRTTTFFTVQGYWYPRGKVDYAAVADKKGLQRIPAAMANAKPYFSLATGYSFLRAEGDGKFKLPLVGTFLRQLDVEDHHMYQVSPRFGLEMPVSKNSSVTMEGMYYFFGPHHSDEYNGPSLFLGFRHRF